MDLREFIRSPLTNLWIKDSGLKYYVLKHGLMPGLIILSSCESDGSARFAMWKFLRKYSATVPFKMEQVINCSLARYMREQGWSEYRVGGVPQFYSPLAMARYDIKLGPIDGPDITTHFWTSDVAQSTLEHDRAMNARAIASKRRSLVNFKAQSNRSQAFVDERCNDARDVSSERAQSTGEIDAH